MSTLESVRRTIVGNLRQSGIYVAFFVIIVMFTIATSGDLVTPQNVSNIIVQNSYILVLAIGMVMVIIAGHIDLSVGSVVAFTGAISGVLTVRMGLPWWLGVLGALAVGALVGAWQGFWVAYVGIPAFIVTLAGMLIFRGLTMVVLGNQQISPFPEEFRNISSGFLNGILGGAGFDLFTMVIAGIAVAGFAYSEFRSRKIRMSYGQPVSTLPLLIAKIVAFGVLVMTIAWKLATYKGLPVVLIILAVLVFAYSLISKRTPFGRHMYAIGGNLFAAELSGIKVAKTNFWLFVNMGVLAAVAGVIFTARLNLAGPKAGVNFELDAIAACFIGGAAVTGGIGTVIGAIVGGLIMGVMNNGMSLMGIGIDYQQAIKGFVLLLAVAFDIWNKHRSGKNKVGT